MKKFLFAITITIFYIFSGCATIKKKDKKIIIIQDEVIKIVENAEWIIK